MDPVEAFTHCADRFQLATRAGLLAAGLRSTSLSDAVADGDLVRLRRGVYARTPLEPWPAHLLSGGKVDLAFLRHAAAVLLELGPQTALRARSAAVLWGLDMLDEPRQLEVQVRRSQSRLSLPDVVARRTASPTQVVGGLHVTTLAATLRGCAQDLALNEAVAVIDSALRRRLVPLSALKGAGRLGRAIRLADPSSGSVLESALRVLLAEHGLRPQSQYVIRDRGRFVARVDFCFPAHRLIVEADGRRWHDPTDVRTFDRRRANSCAALGWRVLRFTWAEVLHDPAYVVATVRSAVGKSV